MDSLVEIDIDDQGMVMPPKNDKILLIDADTIAYTVCLNTEVAEEVLADYMYTPMEWDAIVNDPNYVEEDGCVYVTDSALALSKAEDKLQRIMDKTGCSKFKLHFTGSGKNNFRYKIAPNYKANRTGRTPAGLGQLKIDLAEKYQGTIHEGWEADDYVVYSKLKEPEKYLLTAIDKDVLNSIEGTHFNYYESALYSKDMHFQEVSKHTAMTWRYIQTLTGDKTDGIEGLNRVGPKTAEKIIAGKFSHGEIWKAVVEAYKMKGKTEEDAILTLNLVDMQLLTEDKDNNLYIKLRTKEEMNELK